MPYNRPQPGDENYLNPWENLDKIPWIQWLTGTRPLGELPSSSRNGIPENYADQGFVDPYNRPSNNLNTPWYDSDRFNTGTRIRPPTRVVPPEIPIQDERTLWAYNRGKGTLTDFDENQRAAIDAAIAQIDTAMEDISGLYSTRRTDIDEALPLDPYSDEYATNRKSAAFDLINQLMANEQGALSSNVAGRGFSGGGQMSGPAALLAAKAIGGKASVANAILDEQLKINQQSNLARESLLSTLGQSEAQALGAAGQLRSTLERGDVVDPSYMLDLISGTTSADIGIDFREKLLQAQRELAALGSETNLFEAAMNALQGWATGSGNPGQAAAFNFLGQWS